MSSICMDPAAGPQNSRSALDHVVRIHDPDGENIRRYMELTGLPFGTLCLESGLLTGEFTGSECALVPSDVLEMMSAGESPLVVPHLESGRLFYSARLSGCRDGARCAAGSIALDQPGPPSSDANQYDLLRRLLALAEAEVERVRNDPSQELDDLAEQLNTAYEEISLIQGILRDLHVALDPVELVHLCVNRLHRVIRAEGCAVLIDSSRHASGLALAGEVNLDEPQFRRMLRRMNAAEHNWRQPMVRNHLEETGVSAGCPHVRNLVVAAIVEDREPAGWIFAVNSSDRDEFGTVEASLINSIALILCTHLSNLKLFSEQEDLLLAFVRSLVSTLDAKDSYTRGHSERVARVARRLARQMGLSLREQEAIHLSSLLHDIGKIGVEDAILGKPHKLTPAEFRKLQLHPVIGYDILSGLSNLEHIIPGVRHHHENFDGTGYPDGLSGEDIPLMARIIAVADGYDAMGSDRPYRDGMPLQQVESILADGAGTQWDPDVIAAFMAARHEIATLWRDSPDRE
ncbi:MAG: HD-GYP domain-containing protein [Planctomycetota bacterium]|nr:MAG: HD-GYP domain-containing protein [Planctomycetota bacterium]REJ93416.1 MAG: HD-GYP domain-containing protein [Planctomycetota bacterium]REK25407.1 MAG: HD-GYP domain-containing protein [Planctomycetota bacterium]REK38025.1 MAG: HD-GYP domain-containing protein [Planctomycetota bacterium]